ANEIIRRFQPPPLRPSPVKDRRSTMSLAVHAPWHVRVLLIFVLALRSALQSFREGHLNQTIRKMRVAHIYAPAGKLPPAALRYCPRSGYNARAFVRQWLMVVLVRACLPGMLWRALLVLLSWSHARIWEVRKHQ